jgi:hypothetical protein
MNSIKKANFPDQTPVVPYQNLFIYGKHRECPGREAGVKCFSVLARGYMPRASGDLALARLSLDFRWITITHKWREAGFCRGN